MKTAVITAVFLQVWFSYVFATDGTTPAVPSLAPGRLDRMMPRQPGRDCGTFTFNCRGAEGACNNACYHIHCVNQGQANPDRITYIGLGQDAAREENREQSGCRANNNLQGGSVCRNFPFSQMFTEPAIRHVIGDNQCDEWPPAASIQGPFTPGTIRNSLRCMPSGENEEAGRQLGRFTSDRGYNGPGRNLACAGQLNRGDYFGVLFNTQGADQNKLQYCIPITNVPNYDCSQDGYQFYMTQKPTVHGKISSYYQPFGTDNRYRLEEQTVVQDLMQCSIELTRTTDNDFEYKLTNWRNVDVGTGTGQITRTTGTFHATGLPKDVVVGKTGPKGTTIQFSYGDDPNEIATYFFWTTDSEGDGRGPGTNDGNPLHYCDITLVSNEQKGECWFPCYEP